MLLVRDDFNIPEASTKTVLACAALFLELAKPLHVITKTCSTYTAAMHKLIVRRLMHPVLIERRPAGYTGATEQVVHLKLFFCTAGLQL